MPVKIYTKNNCMPCNFTKKYLDAFEISYETINLDEHPEEIEALKEKGFHGTPVVMVEGYEPITGFRPEQLEKIFN